MRICLQFTVILLTRRLAHWLPLAPLAIRFLSTPNHRLTTAAPLSASLTPPRPAGSYCDQANCVVMYPSPEQMLLYADQSPNGADRDIDFKNFGRGNVREGWSWGGGAHKQIQTYSC